MKYFWLILASCIANFSFSQAINDNFEDGDLSGWTQGTASDWTNSTSYPITGSSSLKHNLSSVEAESYIYHDISSLDLSTQNISWQFNLANYNFDPSGSNRFWVYLTASETDLSSSDVDGYAVGVNLSGSSDILTLWKVTNRSGVAIVSSSFNWGNTNTVGVKVTRSISGVWELLVDTDGGFDSLVSAGTGTNTDYTHDNYFGLFFDFTSSRAGNLRMDDVTVEGTVPSSSSPSISTSTSSISDLDYEFDNGPSTYQSFTLSGNNLTNDITLSAPSNFEISESSGSGFGSSITLIQSSGSVSSTTIYARLASGLSVNSYSGVLSVSSTGATSNISLNGEVTATPTPGLIITEIADPNNTSGSSDKRFIELFNSSNSSIDLTDYKIKKWIGSSSSTSSEETTLQGTLEAYSFYIIAANAISFKSTYGFAANQITSSVVSGNGDDSYALIYTSNGSIYDVYGTGDNTDGSFSSWEYEDGRAERVSSSTTASNTFSSSNWNVHNDSGGGDGAQTSPTNYDPGYWIGATSSETWNGLSSTSWATAGNWASGSVPVSTDNIFIHEATNGPQITSSAIELNNLTIKGLGTLSLDKSSSLKLTGDLTNESGTLSLNSDSDDFSSLIVGGTSSGSITYNRYVNMVGSGEWDLIGSPVDGLSIDSFLSTNATPIATNGSIYALGYYDNAADSWTNYTTSTASSAGNFDIGKGYQMATDSGATLAFTGTVPTSAQTQSVINNDAAGGRRWNLVANPFPSYLMATNGADATNNFLKVNLDAGIIDATYSAFYGWDADGTGYTPYNHTSGSVYIAPGQGFFVAANSSSSANISFTEAMQTTNGGDDFISGRVANTSQEFYLKLYEGDNFIANTKFYFDNNLTLGLDPGYDAGALDQNMAIMSRLVEDDQGVGMSINAMGLDSFEQTVVPLDINRSAGTAFRISLEDINIPEDVEVYLQDTEAQTSTDLRTEDFNLNPETDLSGIGRFYIAMGSSSLGQDDLQELYISIYKALNSDYITIEGLGNVQSAKVRLYNIVGQEVLNKTLETNQSLQRVSTLGLSTGVYVLRLEADSSRVTKKLIID